MALFGHARRANRVLLVAVVANVAVSAANIWTIRRESRDWAPLYGYTDQTVATPQILVANTAARVSIIVTGTKCTREPVDVVGQATWISVNPPGRIVPIGQGVRRREKGCVTDKFDNALPEAVLRDTVEIGGRATWRLTGTDIPIDTRRHGIPATWRTEPVIVIVVE